MRRTVSPPTSAATCARPAASCSRAARPRLRWSSPPPTRRNFRWTPPSFAFAAILTALSPGLIVYSALLMTDPLAALGIVAAAWLFARDPRPLRRGLAAGMVMGLTALALVALAVAAFVASIRLGMLIGLRLDRALHAEHELPGARQCPGTT